MDIFLSASVPLPTRDPVYFQTADVVAIRDAVKALALEILGNGSITFGGHPAITPLLALMLREAFPARRGHIILYQSEFFLGQFPPENDEFIDVRITPSVNGDRQASLDLMRRTMLGSIPFDVGVFIGGMDGVVEEFHLFRELHPNAPVYPIASTGGAAALLFKEIDGLDPSLLSEITYPTLFRTILRTPQ